MTILNSKERQEIEKVMTAFVKDMQKNQVITLFPPGWLWFLFYVLSSSVAVVCIAFLFSGFLYPLSAANQIGLQTILLPMGTAVVLICVTCVLLSLIVQGKKEYWMLSTVFIGSLGALFLCGLLVSNILVLDTPIGVQLIGVLTFSGCIYFLLSRKFYTLVAYFHSKKNVV